MTYYSHVTCAVKVAHKQLARTSLIQKRSFETIYVKCFLEHWPLDQGKKRNVNNVYERINGVIVNKINPAAGVENAYRSSSAEAKRVIDFYNIFQLGCFDFVNSP